MVRKCVKKCDISDNALLCRNKFTCKVTSKTCKVRGNFSCNNGNVIYIISYTLFKGQYVRFGYKNNFKPRFRVYKSDINTGEVRRGVTKYSLTKCTDVGKIKNIEVHVIEQVQEGD